MLFLCLDIAFRKETVCSLSRKPSLKSNLTQVKGFLISDCVCVCVSACTVVLRVSAFN